MCWRGAPVLDPDLQGFVLRGGILVKGMLLDNEVFVQGRGKV